MFQGTVETSLFGKFFGNYSKLEYDDKKLYLFKNGSLEETFNWMDTDSFAVISSGLFGSSLQFSFTTQLIKIKLLKSSECQNNIQVINKILKPIIENKIVSKQQIFQQYTQLEYLRDSKVSYLNNEISPLLDLYEANTIEWKKYVSKDLLSLVDTLSDYIPLTDKIINILRKQFEATILSSRAKFYDNIESNPLTEEQRLAVIRDNDRNLVLAAAGTGKTSVMVAKALDLIDRGLAKPEEILILAYNRDAAKELEERLSIRGTAVTIDKNNRPKVKTFHALGRQILLDAKQSISISVFSEDPLKLDMWISEWFINKMQSDPMFMQTFIDLSYQPINPFDFKTKEAYDNYIRDNEYRTLQNEVVKGYQELCIANWLYLNCIDYEYEPSYVTKRRLEVGFDYRPDFYLTSADIYLEHFGIDRKGNTRVGIDSQQYNFEMQKKRELHKEQNTTLIETYHYNWIEGKLEDTLLQHMKDHDITIKQRPSEEIFQKLNESGFLIAGIKKYLKCLQAIRVERLSDDAILNRLHDYKIANSKQYQELLSDLHKAYIGELNKQNAIDFDDMIIKAITTVDDGFFKPKWTYILVDEFQDISAARMEFLKALIGNGPNPRLTVVGDDWQSIYRFSGGKLELTTQFESRVGSSSQTILQKTFRYNNSIAHTAGEFVMQNPEQYVKKVITHTQVSLPQVYLHDSQVNNQENLELKTLHLIQEILEQNPKASIAVIARYRYLLKDTKEVVYKHIKNSSIKFWTFHGSKGLEADYCILIGFFQGKTGFPNENKEDAVVEALLPSLDTFPHSEERRLLYVGITRAKKKCYLVADPRATSVFINELLAPKFDIEVVSETFNQRYREIFKCNKCTNGYYKLKQGKYGNFYSCTSGASCKSKPRICEKCGAPSIDYEKESICQNPNCHNSIKICDRCGRPMKRRNGRFGEFWGCTGYGIPGDQCKNTWKI